MKARGRAREALEVLAQDWAEAEEAEAAFAAGVVIWHMHEFHYGGIEDDVKGEGAVFKEKLALRRSRLLAAQGTVLTKLDSVEAAIAFSRALELAPADPLVRSLASTFEGLIMHAGRRGW